MEEHKKEMPELEQIDLFQLLQEFWKGFRIFFWVPLVLAVLLGGGLSLRAYLNYTPRYASEATFTIETMSDTLSDIAGTSNYYDKATAEQLAKAFPYLIQSDLMRSMLQQEMGVAWLGGSITAEAVPNTNIFSIQVTSTDPQEAYDILNTVIEIYPRLADYVIGTTEMNMLTPPEVPSEPYNSLSLRGTAVKGAAVGVLLGLLLILAYSATRRTIRTAEDVRRRLNQTCLAALPAVRFKRREKDIDQTVSIQNRLVSSAFQESIRSLRIKFLRAAGERGQIIMVTSTMPGEGKTTVAANLALSLSQNGSRVILVDLDLRNPSVKKALNVTEPSRGIPELLVEKGADPLKYLVELKNSQVKLLAGDKPAANARQQVESRRLAMVLTALREEADFIIVDTPPCGLLGDSAVVARQADASLYVIRAGGPQVSHIMDSLQFLGASGSRMLGCVLNGVQDTRSGYGYGQGYRYGSNRYGKYSIHSKKKSD